VAIGVVVDLIDRGTGLPAWSLLAIVAAITAVRPLREIGRASGRALIPVLIGTARLQIVFGVLLALGLWIEVLVS
jgi:1,4-dihydroxy-2-naphthoate octaprenyltransferase